MLIILCYIVLPTYYPEITLKIKVKGIKVSWLGLTVLKTFIGKQPYIMYVM